MRTYIFRNNFDLRLGENPHEAALELEKKLQRQLADSIVIVLPQGVELTHCIVDESEEVERPYLGASDE
jgi:hypothetical protein